MSFLRHNAPLGVKLEQCGGREEGVQDTGWKYRSHILKGIIAGDRGRAVRAFCGFYVLHSGCIAYVDTSAASNIRRLRRCEVGISLAGPQGRLIESDWRKVASRNRFLRATNINIGKSNGIYKDNGRLTNVISIGLKVGCIEVHFCRQSPRQEADTISSFVSDDPLLKQTRNEPSVKAKYERTASLVF